MQSICITFVQSRPNIFDVGLTLFKCYTNVCVCVYWHASMAQHLSDIWDIWGRILVQVTICCRLQIGRDGHLDQSEAYDISQLVREYRPRLPCVRDILLNGCTLVEWYTFKSFLYIAYHAYDAKCTLRHPYCHIKCVKVCTMGIMDIMETLMVCCNYMCIWPATQKGRILPIPGIERSSWISFVLLDLIAVPFLFHKTKIILET